MTTYLQHYTVTSKARIDVGPAHFCTLLGNQSPKVTTNYLTQCWGMSLTAVVENLEVIMAFQATNKILLWSTLRVGPPWVQVQGTAELPKNATIKETGFMKHLWTLVVSTIAHKQPTHNSPSPVPNAVLLPIEKRERIVTTFSWSSSAACDITRVMGETQNTMCTESKALTRVQSKYCGPEGQAQQHAAPHTQLCPPLNKWHYEWQQSYHPTTVAHTLAHLLSGTRASDQEYNSHRNHSHLDYSLSDLTLSNNTSLNVSTY